MKASSRPERIASRAEIRRKRRASTVQQLDHRTHRHHSHQRKDLRRGKHVLHGRAKLHPNVFSTVSITMTKMATRLAVFNPMFPGPCNTQLLALTEGKNTPRNFPTPTPTAAMVPVWMTRKSVHP